MKIENSSREFETCSHKSKPKIEAKNRHQEWCMGVADQDWTPRYGYVGIAVLRHKYMSRIKNGCVSYNMECSPRVNNKGLQFENHSREIQSKKHSWESQLRTPSWDSELAENRKLRAPRRESKPIMGAIRQEPTTTPRTHAENLHKEWMWGLLCAADNGCFALLGLIGYQEMVAEVWDFGFLW